MIKPKLPVITDYIEDESELIHAGPKAREGYIVPEIIFTYGSSRNHILRMLPILPTMLRTLRNSFRSYKSVRLNPVPGASSPSSASSQSVAAGLPVDLFARIEAFATGLGCSAAGFTEVPPDLIFREKSILYRKAIVVTMEMDKAAIDQAPAKAAGREVWRTYHDLGVIVNKTADFIRKQGAGAQPGPALGGDANYVMLAQKAGLGHIGTHGLLISPGTGPCQRIAVIYTDAELTPTDSDDHAWIEGFCTSCGRCARKCPGEAIFGTPIPQEDGGLLYIDYKKCAVPFSKTMGCSVCIKECIFTKGSYEKIKEKYNE